MSRTDDSVLHAELAERAGGVIEARLLELDLAVAGESKAELLAEFTHAIVLHYEIAMEQGLTPFADLCRRAKARGSEVGAAQPFEELGVIDLPPDVARALAIAIHAPKPDSLHIKTFKRAA